jgi:hypothetical protein
LFDSIVPRVHKIRAHPTWLNAYLATHKLTYPGRLEARINAWFDMTEQYTTQLHELDREEYLHAKRMEWDNQQRLQRALKP